jgi:hypothetical protein
MGDDVIDSGTNSQQYYPVSKKEEDFLTPILVLGGAIGIGYILNKHFLDKGIMGEGRIYNQDIENYYLKLQENKYEDLADKRDFFSRQYRTHNIVYPDIMYEGVRRQPAVDNTFVNRPMPASDDTLLTYAEPSNIVTDEILYEQGNPDIKEDYRITGEIPGSVYRGNASRHWGRKPLGGIDDGASNTTITTEYTPGINEKVRKENPLIVTNAETPSGRPVTKVSRLAPLRPTTRRRFNADFDEKGDLIQKNPVYDTVDYLSDLSLTNEDFREGEVTGRISDESLKVFEDFLVRGTVKAGWEVLPSDDV